MKAHSMMSAVVVRPEHRPSITAAAVGGDRQARIVEQVLEKWLDETGQECSKCDLVLSDNEPPVAIVVAISEIGETGTAAMLAFCSRCNKADDSALIAEALRIYRRYDRSVRLIPPASFSPTGGTA